MSSFLFLGPTGVGKTETTKALAEVFFGREAQIMRLDMSEYSSADAASKLIGSFESGHTGVLSSMLREHPYGVLLLDEFEKTTKEVMNLFLQILDEGFFSDMSGKKVNARNLIIIATSNAGSDLIWQEVKAGNDVSKIKDKIVDSIIAQGVFKPELLNRFDGVIVFHPLQAEHLRLITKLMLQKLHARLAQKGINLAVNDDLVDFVMKYGTDPKFGARPINRAIQEQVEQIVAKKIIAGSLSSGSQLTLTAAELEQSAR
jgi:ATP-dependent Clp protease ATP-binding subunit ClpA